MFFVRSAQLKYIDTPTITDEELLSYYRFLSKADALSAAHRSTLHFLSRASRLWLEGQKISILDMYCGRGDLSKRILQWSKKRGWDVEILAVEKYNRIIELAKSHVGRPRSISFAVKDFTDTAFLKAQQFDYVVSSLSLHSLPDSQAVSFLKRVSVLAKRGFIISDWIRNPLAYWGLRGVTQFWSEKTIQHDAPLAVKKGFTLKEVESLIKEARLEGVTIQAHFGFRFSISHERALALSPQLVPRAGLVGT